MEDFDMESMYKLDEMLKNVDPEKMPSRKEILAMLEEANLSEEMKENLKSMLLGDAPKLLGGLGEGIYLGVLFVLIIVAILLFFGYKLYRSITDKEKKREEKKKAKQMKKKK